MAIVSEVDSSPSTPVQYPSIAVRIPLHRPLWTFVILAINGLAWIAMSLLGGSTNPNTLLFFGAKFNPLIAAGQYWRLLTACFLHIGLMHLAFNSYALFSFGQGVESRFGRARFLALYLLAGLSGSTASFLGSPALSAGASGAIFGLIGAMIAYLARYREQFGAWGRRQFTNVLLVAGYNLVWGFTAQGIDNWGHIGGLVAGLVLGWAYCPHYRPTYTEGLLTLVDKPHRGRLVGVSAALIVFLIALVALGVQMRG